MPRFRPVLALCALALPATVHAADVGLLRITRSVQVSTTPVGAGVLSYIAARDKQGVFDGQAVRTLKRSTAEIRFKDGSILRVNERTDVVVREGASGRSIKLSAGALWIKVAPGVPTRVETPTATATARGTAFEVRFDGRITGLKVDEGSVDFGNGQGTQNVRQGNGSFAGVSRPPAKPFEVPEPADGNWYDQSTGTGMQVLAGSGYFEDLRIGPLTEFGQQGLDLPHPPARGGITIPGGIDRERFLAISQARVQPAINRNLGNLTGKQFIERFGARGASGFFTLNSSEKAFFDRLGVVRVVDWFTVADELGLEYGFSRAFAPGSVTGAPNTDLTFFDRTERNDSLFLAGLAVGLLAGRGDLKLGEVKTATSFYGISNLPDAGGGRQEVRARVGKARLSWEANSIALSQSTGGRQFDNNASVLSVEQSLSPSVAFFAGRRRFYHGPVFQNQNQSQLIAERYSAAGLRWSKDDIEVEGAYLHDANPAVDKAQGGVLGSVRYRSGRGLIGLHYLRSAGLRGGGQGISLSIATPLVPNQIDFYSELGRAPDRSAISTYGFYFPGLFQRFDVDAFLEYGEHANLSKSVTAVVSRDVTNSLQFRMIGDWKLRGSKDFTLGAGMVVRFGGP